MGVDGFDVWPGMGVDLVGSECKRSSSDAGRLRVSIKSTLNLT